MAGSQQESGKESARISIIADHREKRTKTCEWLRTFDAEIIEKQLDVADYIVSDRVGIERKTVGDFLVSLMNQRLFRQMENMASSFERPVVILEGDPKMLFLSRNIHPNTIHGALSSIAVDHGIPIIWTDSPKSTAAQIFWTAYREQGKERRGLQARVCKKTKNAAQQQEFLVAGLPDINSVLGRRMLREFKTVRNVFSLTEEELKRIDGIGDKKARKIWCLLNSGYEEKTS